MFEDVEIVVDDQGNIATVIPVDGEWIALETVSADDQFAPQE